MIEHAYLSNYETVYRSEVIDNVYMNIGYPKRDQLWSDRLSVKNGHESGVCHWLHKNLKPEDIVFDIGSNFGFYPSLISSLNSNTKIHCFEPDSVYFLYLESNKNRCPCGHHWILVNKFVSDTTNKHSISLDEYTKATHIIPSIVKVDIEGAEILLLRGSKNLIKQRKTVFLIEVHSKLLKNFNSSVEEVLACFPDDYRLKALTNLRNNQSINWSDDLSRLHDTDHHYLYAGAKELQRKF